MLEKMTIVLLRTLLDKTHSLLGDEIAGCLYNLISADAQMFFTHNLPHFLASIPTLNSMQQESLLSNFSRDMVSAFIVIFPGYLFFKFSSSVSLPRIYFSSKQKARGCHGRWWEYIARPEKHMHDL